jgi:hypothetical protein
LTCAAKIGNPGRYRHRLARDAIAAAKATKASHRATAKAATRAAARATEANKANGIRIATSNTVNLANRSLGNQHHPKPVVVDPATLYKCTCISVKDFHSASWCYNYTTWSTMVVSSSKVETAFTAFPSMPASTLMSGSSSTSPNTDAYSLGLFTHASLPITHFL